MLCVPQPTVGMASVFAQGQKLVLTGTTTKPACFMLSGLWCCSTSAVPGYVVIFIESTSE